MVDRDDVITNGIFAVLSFFAAAYIQPRLPTLPDGDLPAILSDPNFQAILIVIGGFLFLHKVWYGLWDLLSKDSVERRSAGFAMISSPPDEVLYNASIRYGDVDWNGRFGVTRGSERVYVDGPYCPVCEISLGTRTNNRRIFSNKQLWACPSCDFNTSQNHELDGTQKVAVEDITKNEAYITMNAIKARDNDRIQEIIEGVIDKAIEINPSVENYLDDPDNNDFTDSMMAALHQAIDETVKEEQIRQNGDLRAVFEHEFDYIHPDRERNYDLMDEIIDESGIRRRLR